MSRKKDYNNNIRGNIGGLDIVSANGNADFVINKAGAKVYKDATKHSQLEIPSDGKVYEVLSLGILPPGIPIATVKIDDLPVAHKLPTQLVGWVQSMIGMSMQGTKLFPAKVEFRSQGDSYYAELL